MGRAHFVVAVAPGRVLILAGLLVIAACASAPTSEQGSDAGAEPTTSRPTTTSQAETSPPAGLGEPMFEIELSDAVSVNLTARDDLRPAVAWITNDSVNVARLDLGTQGLDEEMAVSGSAEPFAHPIERPAISIASNDTLDVAFTSLMNGGSVFHTRGGSDGFNEPVIVSGDPRPETNLVHATRDPSDRLVLAWLEDSTLSVATEGAQSITEVESVDDLTCDCCNPAPRFIGDGLVVAYRDYEVIEGSVARNVKALASQDGGETFTDPVPVADDDWYIDACPFSGPSGVVVEDTLVVAWMDARQSTHPDQSTSSIWVDRSTDSGASFGTDVLVTSEGINRWPMMTTDDAGVIHLVWEVQGRDGGIFYASSADRGGSFTAPTALVLGSKRDGSPKSPSVAFHDGVLLVTWGEGSDGYLAGWDIAG